MATKINRVPWINVVGKQQKVGGVTAAEAFRNLGEYDVALQNVYIEENWDLNVIGGYNAIVRQKSDKYPTEKVFNIVSNRYHLVSPEKVVQLWDEHVGLPVTSIGALDGGERFFLGTQLPKIDINGDEIENTLLLISPMNGKESISAILAPVRLVCSNGLVSVGDVVDSFKLRHYEHNIKFLPAWLSNMYERNIANLVETTETYQHLSEYILTPDDIARVLRESFPTPLPSVDPDNEKQVNDYQVKYNNALVRRGEAARLFNGAGTGISDKGTAFDLFNSIVELIDYGVPQEVKKSSARSANLGAAVKVKHQALNTLRTLAGG